MFFFSVRLEHCSLNEHLFHSVMPRTRGSDRSVILKITLFNAIFKMFSQTIYNINTLLRLASQYLKTSYKS